MQALRDFWAKSLLNKGVVLGLVFLLCCCPLSLAGRGERSTTTASAPTTSVAEAQPTTEQPVATAAPTAVVPTETAVPTEEPEPTVTPEPSPSSQPVAGIGVTRSEVQGIYEQAGFAFEASALADGGERVIGTGSNSSLIELIGPAGELTQASAIVAFSRTNESQRQISAIYLTGLISKVAPQHLDEISTWLSQRLSSQEDGELVTGPYQSSVIFLAASDGVLVTYTIKAAD